jgi:chemotaxis response regulator CheB
MYKVLVVCGDAVRSAKLRLCLHGNPEFEVSITGHAGLRAAKQAIELLPELIVLEMDTERQNLEIAEVIKIFVQEIPIFLIISLPTMESEKKALAHGIDAVFDEEADFESLMLNAKAVVKCRAI